jgi:UDP-N-acetylglucosamine 4,6-dehydratase
MKQENLRALIEGKNILVTGGTGSIGGEIAKKILCFSPNVVRIFSRDECKQLYMKEELKDWSNVRFLVGDIRDKERVMRAIEDIDIVFHAAALKHVPACEYNPFEAVKTNVIGTQNLIDAALYEEVEKFIAISTDKAVHPTNTMGATKLLSEKLVSTANYYKGRRSTVFACMRFGNVLGSSGSIIPFVTCQIKRGGPITLTNPEMCRFVMPIAQAVSLILEAAHLAKGGEIFVLKMPVINIADLIEVLIRQLAPRFGYSPQDIKVKHVGVRKGEKLQESLMTEDEVSRARETENMFILEPFYKEEKESHIVDGAFVSLNSSHHSHVLSKKEIEEMLTREGIL